MNRQERKPADRALARDGLVTALAENSVGGGEPATRLADVELHGCGRGGHVRSRHHGSATTVGVVHRRAKGGRALRCRGRRKSRRASARRLALTSARGGWDGGVAAISGHLGHAGRDERRFVIGKDGAGAHRRNGISRDEGIGGRAWRWCALAGGCAVRGQLRGTISDIAQHDAGGKGDDIAVAQGVLLNAAGIKVEAIGAMEVSNPPLTVNMAKLGMLAGNLAER